MSGKIKLPEIGEIITTGRAIELCTHFGYDYLVERIKVNPGRFRDWEFDGASMVPDGLFARLFNIPNLTLLALKHDLGYAYGEPGNDREKLRVDLEFGLGVLNDGASAFVTKAVFAAVDVGGAETFKTEFSWAYAWR